MAESLKFVIALAEEAVGLGPVSKAAREAERALAKGWKAGLNAAERVRETADRKLERMRGTFDDFDCETLVFEASKAKQRATDLERDAKALEKGAEVDGQSPGNAAALRAQALQFKQLADLLTALVDGVGKSERRF